MKQVIVINGAGGVGKDTLCDIAAKKYDVMNISSVDPIKKAAMILGWDQKKDLISRKFLADLKELSVQYNDWPTKYLLEQHALFCTNDKEILFVHIREGREIEHFMNNVPENVCSLLIRRNAINHFFGNSSDDDVENFNYDYVYNNDLPLELVENDFLNFLEEVLLSKK